MKLVHWVKSSRKDLLDMPHKVRSEFGFAPYQAQLGSKSFYAMPMTGFGGAGVLEVVVDNEGDTFRAIYTVKFSKAIYVLHVFQKKSKKGSKTPRADIGLIKSRLNDAAEHYRTTHELTNKKERAHGQGT